MIDYASRDIYERLSTIALKRSISINFFVSPNTLFLKHLFQMGPFETDLFHADLFQKDKTHQTGPSSFSKIFVADSFFLQTKSQNKIAFKYVNVFGNKIQNKKTHFNSHMRFVFLMHPYCL